MTDTTQISEIQVNILRRNRIKEDYKNICEFIKFRSDGRHLRFPDLKFDFNNSWAYAWYDDKSEDIVFNHKYDYDDKASIIHELTHFICSRFHIDTEEKGCHHLEFAIINGVLRNTYSWGSGCFFRAYDIQDDPVYEKLAINPKRWDDMIKGYKMTSVDELVLFACEKAEKYRSLCK